MFKQDQLSLTVSILTTKVNNLPSDNIAVMVGILHIAFIDKQEDGKWKITVAWPHAFPFATNLMDSRNAALHEVMSRLKN